MSHKRKNKNIANFDRRLIDKKICLFQIQKISELEIQVVIRFVYTFSGLHEYLRILVVIHSIYRYICI